MENQEQSSRMKMRGKKGEEKREIQTRRWKQKTYDKKKGKKRIGQKTRQRTNSVDLGSIQNCTSLLF